MTQILKQGDRGALVSLLQLGLTRAGQTPGALDGIFGAQTAAAVRAFQAASALAPDGIVGARTHRALLPYYTGFVTRTIRAGDTFSALARQYGTSVDAIALANPYLAPERLPLGRALTIPLPFSVTPADIPYSSALIGYIVRGLAARYPMLAVGEFGRSVLGRPLWYLTLGSGPKLVFYTAAHHANEWITTPLLLTFCEQLCARLGDGGDLEGQNIRDLLSKVTLVLAPAVDPDGIDLVTGALDAETTAAAKALAANYPDGLEGEHPRHRPQPPVPRGVEHRARDQIRRGLHASRPARLCRPRAAGRAREPGDVRLHPRARPAAHPVVPHAGPRHLLAVRRL